MGGQFLFLSFSFSYVEAPKNVLTRICDSFLSPYSFEIFWTNRSFSLYKETFHVNVFLRRPYFSILLLFTGSFSLVCSSSAFEINNQHENQKQKKAHYFVRFMFRRSSSYTLISCFTVRILL